MAYVGLLLAVLVDHTFHLLVPEGALLGAAPDLPLMTALYVGFRARGADDLGYALVLGLFADSFSARPLGHFAFLFGATALLAQRARRFVPPDAYASHAVACLFCALVAAGLGLLMALVTVDGPVGPGFVRALGEAVSSALLAPFVFAFWDRSRFFRRALGRRRYEFAR